MHTTDVFKGSQASQTIASNLGVSPLPGSETVWDRTTQRFLGCTPELCSKSDPVARSGRDGNVTLHVNRVLYTGGGGRSLAMLKRAEPLYRQASAL